MLVMNTDADFVPATPASRWWTRPALLPAVGRREPDSAYHRARPHDYTRAMRETTCAFVDRWLKGIGDGFPVPEPDIEQELFEEKDPACSSLRAARFRRTGRKPCSRSGPRKQRPSATLCRRPPRAGRRAARRTVADAALGSSQRRRDKRCWIAGHDGPGRSSGGPAAGRRSPGGHLGGRSGFRDRSAAQGSGALASAATVLCSNPAARPCPRTSISCATRPL